MCIDQLKTYVEIAVSLATIAAILIGGWWTWRNFIRNRLKYPRIRLSHSFYESLIDSENRLVRITLSIDNQSNILVKLGTVTMRVLQINPWPAEILDPNKMIKENDSYYDWPYIEERIIRAGTVEMEPNETEEFHFDFVIKRAYRTIGIYSFIDNVYKRRKRIGWHLTNIYDIIEKEVPNE